MSASATFLAFASLRARTSDIAKIFMGHPSGAQPPLQAVSQRLPVPCELGDLCEPLVEEIGWHDDQRPLCWDEPLLLRGWDGWKRTAQRGVNEADCGGCLSVADLVAEDAALHRVARLHAKIEKEVARLSHRSLLASGEEILNVHGAAFRLWKVDEDLVVFVGRLQDCAGGLQAHFQQLTVAGPEKAWRWLQGASKALHLGVQLPAALGREGAQHVGGVEP
eukprot:CAMPEP_0195139826 /NCGR_PEP_ID=MMETSP0448-20130528/160079_1 /TAXON_ID=66468 /ORGANISM="Heterocapsa triquestra, Strain CCMP 448" /LENGTH=220 /DNA_ID=CAMNT_0040178143 /DNA_START=59 /DNA_END=720 /DNA_ORIENTATION=-